MGEFLIRHREGAEFYLCRIRRDGTEARRVFSEPILDLFNISPDRRFIIAGFSPDGGKARTGYTVAIPTGGGASVRRICEGCEALWSADWKYFYVGGLPRDVSPKDLRGLGAIETPIIIPGLDPATYAYLKRDTHANLYRTPFE